VQDGGRDDVGPWAGHIALAADVGPVRATGRRAASCGCRATGSLRRERKLSPRVMITEGFQFLRSDLVPGLFLMIAEAADAAERTRPMIVRQRSPAGATLSTCSERKRPTQTVSSGRSASLIGWLVEPTMALACGSVSTIWAIGGWRRSFACGQVPTPLTGDAT